MCAAKRARSQQHTREKRTHRIVFLLWISLVPTTASFAVYAKRRAKGNRPHSMYVCMLRHFTLSPPRGFVGVPFECMEPGVVVFFFFANVVRPLPLCSARPRRIVSTIPPPPHRKHPPSIW